MDKNLLNPLAPPKKVAKTIKVLKQTGNRKSVVRDMGRKALLPGQRISKTGKVYWETRKNRSDQANKKL